MAGAIAYYEIEWRPANSDEEWDHMILEAGSTTAKIAGVDRNKFYTVRARSVGPTGLKSIWKDISHTIPGNAVPDVPQNVTAQAVADGVLLQWSYPKTQASDVETCIERSTTASGPWVQINQVRATSSVATERADGTYYYRLRSRNFRGDFSDYSAVVSGDPETLAELNTAIANALREAENAAAFADGSVNTFWQWTPPTSGQEIGDIWFDTNDVSVSNPKTYRWRKQDNGSFAWIHSPNDALAQSIIQANNAQSTADGKVKMFVGANPPGSGYQLHDLWFNTVTRTLHRWDGNNWNNRIGDLTELTSDALVLNPDFEAGLTYWQNGGGWYAESSANAAFLGGYGAVRPANGGGRSDGPLVSNRTVSVTPGQRLFISAKIRNLLGNANGSMFVSYAFYNASGTYINERGSSWAEGVAIDGTEWRQTSKKVTVPHGAAYARVLLRPASHTSGYWCVDGVRAAHVDDVTEATVNGENMIPNYNFSQNTGNFPVTQRDLVANEMITDGWKVVSLDESYDGIYGGLEDHATVGRCAFAGDAGGTITPGTANVYYGTIPKFSVKAGEKYSLDVGIRIDIGNATPAGVDRRIYAGIWGFNSAGTNVYYGGYTLVNQAGGAFEDDIELTIPSDVVTIQPLVGVWYNNTTGSNITMPWATQHVRFYKMMLRRILTLDDTRIRDGDNYGRIHNDDLYTYNGWRRSGLRIMGSRYRLGGPRNFRTAQVMGFSAVRTVGALTATSEGNISVNAHTVDLNGETVTYSAVSNAISGKAQGSTWVVFCLDPYMDGGVQTYYAQNTVLSAQQAGDGAVHMGTITIPSSGSSGGGGGGNDDPWDWCVDYDTIMPDGRYLRDYQPGEGAWCIDVTDPDARPEWVILRAMGQGEEECYRLVTGDMVSIVQSKSTPMTLPDGRTLRTPEMMGQPVVTWIDGIVRRSVVVDMQYLGVRPVLKPDFGDRMFFAGELPDRQIATHNANQKP